MPLITAACSKKLFFGVGVRDWQDGVAGKGRLLLPNFDNLTSIPGAHIVDGDNQFCLVSTCAPWDIQAPLPLPAK